MVTPEYENILKTSEIKLKLLIRVLTRVIYVSAGSLLRDGR
jgi:hypothetical protein